MIETSECLWFYEKDGEESGPLFEVELLQLLKSGAVFPDTLLWTSTMVDWQPALELEPFRSVLREGQSVWDPNPRPWVRFWARRVDLAIYEALFLGFMARFGEHLADLETAVGLVMVLAMIMVETCLLTFTGTTIGKWLFNISLSTPAGQKLSFHTALYRTFLLWLRGLGFGIPFVSVVTMAVGLRNLTLNGESSWDRDGGTVVRHRKVSPLRWVGAFLILATFFICLTRIFWPEIQRQVLEMQKLQVQVEKKA